MPSALAIRHRVAAASLLAGLVVTAPGIPVAGAAPSPVPLPEVASSAGAAGSADIGARSSEAAAASSEVTADVLTTAALVTDLTGDTATRDAALNRLPEPRRTELLQGLEVMDSPVPAPDFTDPSTHIVVPGNALPADGTVHPTLANRLAVAEELAAHHPAAPVVLTGGRTEHGHVEAEAMRDWLVARGMPEDCIILEDRSWSTVSNARNTHALVPEPTSLVVVTSESHLRRAVVDFTLAYGPAVTVTGAAAPDEPPVGPGGDGDRTALYQDVLMWYLLPDHVLADGLPPLFGPGIARPFQAPAG